MHLITKLLGMTVVDVQHWDCRMRHGHVERAICSQDDDDWDVVNDFDIRTLANLIGRLLADGRFKYYGKSNGPGQMITSSTDMTNRPLTCIIGEDGSWN